MLLTSLMRIALTRSLKPFIFKGQFSNVLSYESENNLGLYVHIPFCRSICSFCPYCKETFDASTAQRYKKALLMEIDRVGIQSTRSKDVTSLYFGGGTPALMVDDLSEIIQRLNQYFNIQGKIGVELHPSDITEDNLRKLKDMGVSMLSVGIQSFNKDCLGKIFREYGAFEDKLSQVAEYRFDVVDVDLIFGIPGQNEEILRTDIKTAFEYGATQISTYPFIDFTFADNRYKPMNHRKKRRLLRYINGLCEEFGLKRTSVWTFTRKGSEKYSSITRDAFLGFGVSATTLLKNSFKINTFSIEEYIHRISNDQLPTSLTLDFSLRQRAVYHLFWSAYGLIINDSSFKETIGTGLDSMFGFELWFAKMLGWVRQENRTYYLTEAASYLYHYFEQQYTTAYIDKMWNISRNVAFPDKIVLR